MLSIKQQIKEFVCDECSLESEPNYDLKSVFNQMTELKYLSISLNITEIPTNFIGRQLDLSVVEIKSNQLIIKSGAFQQLKNLQFLYLQNAKINRIENGAFKTNYTKLTNPLHIMFRNCNLTNQSFQNGSFYGILRTSIEIALYHININ